jgi:hypothetical protein
MWCVLRLIDGTTFVANSSSTPAEEDIPDTWEHILPLPWQEAGHGTYPQRYSHEANARAHMPQQTTMEWRLQVPTSLYASYC